MVSLMVSLMVLPYSSTNSIAEPTKHTKGSHSETQHSPINKEAGSIMTPLEELEELRVYAREKAPFEAEFPLLP